MVRRWIIATCLLLAPLATALNAQPPGRSGFGGFFGGRGRLLIDLNEVRKELSIDDQQAELLDALQEDLAEQRLALREEDEGPRSADETVQRLRFKHLIQKLTAFDRRSETLITVVLEPDQANRLAELYLQRDGLRAFERPEVATKLELSDEQKQRLQSLRETFVDNRPRGSTPEQRSELRKKEQEALRELLNEEQQTLWQQLLGKPFDFSVTWRRGSRNR
jgi:hypothetical protein